MAWYTYKDVLHAPVFLIKEWEKETGREFGCEADYDGDIHEVSAFTIEKLHGKLSELNRLAELSNICRTENTQPELSSMLRDLDSSLQDIIGDNND